MKSSIARACLIVVAACQGGQPSRGFGGKPPVASCDYRADSPEGATHSCTEIFDPKLVAAQEAFCNGLTGPQDHPTFARGTACPSAGRLGGCVEPNGTIRWTYAGTESCDRGLKFRGGKPPVLGAPATYRCANANVCIEERSVVDLSSTMKGDCEAAGATFATGACPTENLVGRCTVSDHSGESVRLYYAPGVPAAGAREDCDAAEGSFAGP